MTNRTLWGAVLLLGVACAAEGSYILQHREPERPRPAPGLARDATRDLDRWTADVREEIGRAGKVGEREFDNLFGDRFFDKRVDPFAEIGRVEREVRERLVGKDRGRLDDSFRDWFGKRIDLAGISSRVEEKGGKVDVTFDIPGLDAKSVKVDVNPNRIRLGYEATGKATSGGATARLSESFEKLLPLPEDADPNGFEVRKDRSHLTLIFNKRERVS